MAEGNGTKVTVAKEKEINAALRLVAEPMFGVLDNEFLRQSVGTLDPKHPLTVTGETSMAAALDELRSHKIGCLLVVDQSGKLIGLLSERDYVLRVAPGTDLKSVAVSTYMTPNPVAELPDVSVAYALNLMSTGGFRHLPLVDSEGMPIGIISVKDVVDFIVNSYTDALLDFKIPDELE